MVAGSVAFFAFLAVFPTLIALLTVIGLVADPASVTSRVGAYAASLPPASQQLLTGQLAAASQGGGGLLGFGLLVSCLVAFWLAATGTRNLISAVTLAYGEDDHRGFLTRGALAAGLTLGGGVFLLLALALLTLAPTVLGALELGAVGLLLAQVLRWLLLAAMPVLTLALVYRVAPDRLAPRFRWVSPGAITATGLWLLGSLAFDLYLTHFDSYNKIYGSLAGVVMLLLWLYLTSYVVLLGAEINAASERHTTQNTTRGNST